jgi:hypothetical protein
MTSIKNILVSKINRIHFKQGRVNRTSSPSYFFDCVISIQVEITKKYDDLGLILSLW